MSDKKPSEFNNEKEALEFLLQQHADKKRKEKWKASFNNNDEDDNDKKIFRRRFMRYASIAASFIILLAVVYNYTFQNSETILDDMIDKTVYLEDSNTRGGNNTQNNFKDDIKSGNYKAIIEHYANDNTIMDYRDKYTLAFALFKNEEFKSKELNVLLNDLIESNAEFKYDALWISALTNIKSDKESLAISQLRQLQKYDYKTNFVDKLLLTLTK